MVPTSTTHRLVKSSVQDLHGRLYVFWQHKDRGEVRGFEEVFSLLQRDPGAIEIHLEPPPAEA